jgi:hypothetical protein
MKAADEIARLEVLPLRFTIDVSGTAVIEARLL